MKTLTDILGEGWRVEPCYGMVRDLPTDKLSIDVENDFRPTLTIAPGKGNLIRRLMKVVRDCEAVYVATPPNRDGEAMAWHILALSPDAKDKPIYRVTLIAFTPDTIRTAFAAPRPLDMKQVEAHMTRRIVDRLIGWSVNAQVRKSRGLKMALTYDGMVALRLLAKREQDNVAFTLQTGWRAAVVFARDGERFTAQVMNTKGAPLTLRNEEQAAQLETLLTYGTFWVDKTGQVTKAQSVPDALTLRALIQTAKRELNLPPNQTLALVETLCQASWITHPDGVPLPDTSEAAKAYIRREYGTDYVAPDVIVTSGIAPTDVNRIPKDLPGDGVALYALVWKHFIVAHMPPAQERIMAARILVGASKEKPYPLELRATAKLLYFDGWHRVVPTTAQDEVLPFLPEGTTLQLMVITLKAVTHDSPAHFTEGTLTSALATLGMSVASAARAVEQLQATGYITAEEDRLTLSESGRVVADYLAASFADLTSSQSAAELNTDIAGIETGTRERLTVLRAFWSRFGSSLRPVPAPRAIAEHKPIVLRPAEEV